MTTHKKILKRMPAKRVDAEEGLDNNLTHDGNPETEYMKESVLNDYYGPNKLRKKPLRKQ